MVRRLDVLVEFWFTVKPEVRWETFRDIPCLEMKLDFRFYRVADLDHALRFFVFFECYYNIRRNIMYDDITDTIKKLLVKL